MAFPFRPVIDTLVTAEMALERIYLCLMADNQFELKVWPDPLGPFITLTNSTSSWEYRRES